MDFYPKQDHLTMNEALDRTIILGLQIVLDHGSLSTTGQKQFIGSRLDVSRVLFIIILSSYLSAFLSICLLPKLIFKSSYLFI